VVEALRLIYRRVSIVSAVGGSTRTLDELARLRPDVVFNLAFSAQPCEASFAGCLDMMGIPYTGSGPRGIALTNDKVRSRHLLRAASVRVPRFIELAPGRPVEVDLTPPFIVKPASLAGSNGIYADSVAKTREGVAELVERIWNRFGVAAVCDEFIVGRELRVGTVESARGKATIAGVSEWRFGSAAPGWGFKTEAIRINQRVRQARRVTRGLAALSRREAAELTTVARAALSALDVKGYSTLDVRVDQTGRLVVIEVNANPGLWSGSAIWGNPSFESNLRKIVNAALRGAPN
jgi:D-alanine-D-alanine ligase-like ATP-grasp enzyme